MSVSSENKTFKFFAGVSALFILLWLTYQGEAPDNPIKVFIAANPSIFFFIIASPLLVLAIQRFLKYLQGETNTETVRSSSRTQKEANVRNMNPNFLEKHVVELFSTFVEKELRPNISNHVKDYITKNMSANDIKDPLISKAYADLKQEIREELKTEYNDKTHPKILSAHIDQLLLPLETKTTEYIIRLRNNSIANLLIGILATTIAIVVLLVILTSNKSFLDLNTALIYFIPRLTFVISIQLFAFFFLRLYKNNLDDNKYFQNELTNINSKNAAIRIAKALNKEEVLASLLIKMMDVERNFKLGQGETMWSIEKAKIEKDTDIELFKTFQEFMKKYGKG